MADFGRLLEQFVVEARENLATAEQGLLGLEDGAADAESINRIFRAVHSVKGAAGFFGLTSVNGLAHELENLLNMIRNHELEPTPPRVDALLSGVDQLNQLLNDANNSNAVDVSAFVERLKASRSDDAGGAPPDSQPVHLQRGSLSFDVSPEALRAYVDHGYRLVAIEFDLVSDVEDRGKTLLTLHHDILQIGELVDSRLELAHVGGLDSPLPQHYPFYALVATVLESDMLSDYLKIPQDRITAMEDPRSLVQKAQAATPPKAAAPTATPAASSASAAPAAAISAPAKAAEPAHANVAASPGAKAEDASKSPRTSKAVAVANANLRVSVGVLDRLMNLTGELVLARNQLLQAISSRQSAEIPAVATILDRVTSEIQDAVLRTRMQPVDSEFTKFPRIVRDLTRQLGKQCELTIEGREVELDKTVLEAIADPLTHLIRNAVDHGIEMPEARLAAGKATIGRIVLRAFHRGGKVHITIADDGKGINVEAVKRKAIANGLLTTEQAAEMPERAALRLIFAAGLSTAEKVTDISGRGVGMDVVRSNLERIGGTVDIESQAGRGTTIRIALPLTLAIMPALIVRSNDQRFALPQAQVRELVGVERGELSNRIERLNGAVVFRLRDELLPLVRLGDALGYPKRDDSAGAEAQLYTVVVLESDALRFGLAVDAIEDSTEVVVKPLGQHLRGLPCVSGATILGDGTLALILEAASIANHTQLAVASDSSQTKSEESADAANADIETILLFRTAKDEQFGVPMSLVARVERATADQIRAIGKHMVFERDGESLPLIVLSDLIDSHELPAQDTLNVILVGLGEHRMGILCGEITGTHPLTETVDTLSLRERGVLGSVVISGTTTRLIDAYELAQASYPHWFERRVARRNAADRPKRLLLAEDTNFFRRQIEQYLVSSGFQVVSCEDGADAWTAMEQASPPFDLVVTDIEMPRMNGLELTRNIRGDSRFEKVPVIAVTSLSRPEEIARGKEAGITEYLIKLDREKLLDAVGKTLNLPRTSAAQSATPEDALIGHGAQA